MSSVCDTTSVRGLGLVLWNYLRLGRPLERREAIVVFGGHDLRIAEWAARLWLDGWAPKLIISGGLGYYTSKIWHEPEAHKFRRIAIERGVDPDAILIEDQSTNSGENVVRTLEVLHKHGMTLRRAICVQKPYVERRALLTLKKQWPTCDFLLSSPPISYECYPHPDVIEFEKLINELVGQVDRVEKYPLLGFMAKNDVPQEVLRAKRRLVGLGFVNHLVPP
ncbi:MAG TPA: YdcF family protein [Steroidobacteraceae bacterium]|jgi:uncharacterized SAM-binding protein YcdF (DUF218 family)|nr:YdcF family protein [Steroidobacteraceae bacterium]